MMVLSDAGGPIMLLILGGAALLILGAVAALVALSVFLIVRAVKKNKEKQG